MSPALSSLSTPGGGSAVSGVKKRKKLIPSGPPTTVEYVIVAGGGGGGTGSGTVDNGSGRGGAGGAGGFLQSTFNPSIATSYTVTIGSGGSIEQNGNDSSIVNIATATYGGRGGSTATNINGQNGGSGGGGGSKNGPGWDGPGLSGSGGTGTSGQGYAGAMAQSTYCTGDYDDYGRCRGGVEIIGLGGGGGGAGGAATDQNGGIGISYFDNFGTAAAGGSCNPSGNAGGANTGNGGDGDGTGFAGGSGVVVIRYPSNFTEATSTTGSPIVSISNGYRYYKFTGSGSITF